jgi:hypothetical protein
MLCLYKILKIERPVHKIDYKYSVDFLFNSYN